MIANERLKQIRERARETPHYFTADFHFLLSLLDSQAAWRRGPYSEECRAAIDELELRFESESVELCSIEYAHQRESHGATTMRSRCVGQVEKDLKAVERDKLYRTSQGWHSDDIAHALRELLAKLSALPLEQVEQEKQR